MPQRDPDAPTTGTRRGREEERASSPSTDVEPEGRERTEELKQKGREKAEELRRRGRETVEEARGEMEEQIDRGTSRAAEGVDSVARALATAAEQLEVEGRGRLADYTRRAATRAGRMSGYLKDEDPRSMMTDLEEMARSHPGVFVGTTFAAGLALGRFLRSSEPAPGPGDTPRERSPAGEGRMSEPGAAPPPAGTPGSTPPPPPTSPRSRSPDPKSAGEKGGHDG